MLANQARVGRLVVRTTAAITGKVLDDRRSTAAGGRDGEGIVRAVIGLIEMKNDQTNQREARHLFRLCRTNGSLDETRVRRVVQSVLGSKRRGRLALANEFERLVKLDQLQHTARVESAVKLSPELQIKVEASLTRMYGPGMHTSFTETPALNWRHARERRQRCL